jgi:phosphoribosylformylglycinamidine (FGAM) synthase PurS component
MIRTIEVSLKIPDNVAFTARFALRRLDVGVARIERGTIYAFDDEGDVEALIARIEADETIFNPNLHQLRIRRTEAPEPGEAWIEPLNEGAPHATAWRLYDESGNPVNATVVAAAVERLLCNPAIEKAVTAKASSTG